MARRYETNYRLKPGDNLGDPEFWNRRFEDLDRRVDGNEQDLEDVGAVADRIEAVALQRLDQSITPLVEQTRARIASIPAMFTAGSLSSITIGTGTRTVVIDDATRDTFAAVAYANVSALDDMTKGFVGRVSTYDSATGELVLDVVQTTGTGTFDRWRVTLAAPPDIEHASRHDNPHAVTAAQVGAYTKAQVDEAIAAVDVSDQLNTAVASIRGGSSSTIKALSDRIDQNATDIIAARARIDEAAAQLAAGVPSLAFARAMATELGRLRMAPFGTPDGFVEPFSDNSKTDPTSTGYYIDGQAGHMILGSGLPPMARENLGSYPEMNSNTANLMALAGYQVGATSEYAAAQAAWKAFDAQNQWTSTTNYWQSAVPVDTTAQSLWWKYPVPVRLAGIILAGYYNNSAYDPKEFLVQGSPTGADGSWTTLYTHTGGITASQKNLIEIPEANQGFYAVYRIYITKVVAAAYPAIIGRLEPLLWAPVHEFWSSLPKLVGNNTTTETGVTGFEASAQYSSAGAYLAFNAANQVSGDNYGSGTNGQTQQWLQLKIPYGFKAGAISIQGYWNGSDYLTYTQNFLVEGSLDGGVTFKPLYRTTGRINYTNGDRCIVPISPLLQDNYNCYRITNYSIYNNQNSAYEWMVTDFQILGVISQPMEAKGSQPFMTGPSTPAGHSISASSTEAGFDAYRSMDGQVNKPPATNQNTAGWNATVLATLSRSYPAPLYAAGIRMWHGNSKMMPPGFNVQGKSLTDGTWVTLYSISQASLGFYGYAWLTDYHNGGGWIYFPFKTPGMYSEFRYNQTVLNGNNRSSINEWEILQGVTGPADWKSLVYARPVGVPGKATIGITVAQILAGSLTPQTTFEAFVSRNGGGQFKRFALAATSLGNGIVQLDSDVLDLSDQPPDNKMVLRLKASNGLTMRVDSAVCLGAT